MYFLIYVSSASREFSETELRELLAQSRLNNENLGITGSLYTRTATSCRYSRRADAVKALYGRIALDPRHRGILTLLEVRKRTPIPRMVYVFYGLNSPEASRDSGLQRLSEDLPEQK
jgi:hypothetical protein